MPSYKLPPLSSSDFQLLKFLNNSMIIITSLEVYGKHSYKTCTCMLIYRELKGVYNREDIFQSQYSMFLPRIL